MCVSEDEEDRGREGGKVIMERIKERQEGETERSKRRLQEVERREDDKHRHEEGVQGKGVKERYKKTIKKMKINKERENEKEKEDTGKVDG